MKIWLKWMVMLCSRLQFNLPISRIELARTKMKIMHNGNTERAMRTAERVLNNSELLSMNMNGLLGKFRWQVFFCVQRPIKVWPDFPRAACIRVQKILPLNICIHIFLRCLNSLNGPRPFRKYRFDLWSLNGVFRRPAQSGLFSQNGVMLLSSVSTNAATHVKDNVEHKIYS